jgi:hypothetical protein
MKSKYLPPDPSCRGYTRADNICLAYRYPSRARTSRGQVWWYAEYDTTSLEPKGYVYQLRLLFVQGNIETTLTKHGQFYWHGIGCWRIHRNGEFILDGRPSLCSFWLHNPMPTVFWPLWNGRLDPFTELLSILA